MIFNVECIKNPEDCDQLYFKNKKCSLQKGDKGKARIMKSIFENQETVWTLINNDSHSNVPVEVFFKYFKRLS